MKILISFPPLTRSLRQQTSVACAVVAALLVLVGEGSAAGAQAFDQSSVSRRVLRRGPARLAAKPKVVEAPVPGRLFSQSGAGYGGIVAFNPGGSFGFQLTPHTFVGSAFYGNDQRSYTSFPSISDDGRIMAVTSNRRTGGLADNYFIHVLNGDGSNIRQITFPYFGGYTDESPVISPDGTKVAFISRRGTNVSYQGEIVRNRQLFIIDTDGSNLTQVTSGDVRINPGDNPSVETFAVDWAPDSQRLVYRGSRIVNNAGTLIYHPVIGIINLQTDTDTVLFWTGSTGQSYGLDWSPSGKYIVGGYGGEAQGAPAGRIYIYNTQTSALTEDFRVGNAGQGAGTIRVAPDDSFYIVPWADGSFTAGYRLVSLEAPSEIRSYPFPIAGVPFYWQPGSNWPAPSRLVAEPAYREIPRGFDGLLQVNAALYGADGSVLSRMAAQWDVIENGGTYFSPWGDLKDYPGSPGGYSRFRADNAGFTADFVVQNGKARMIFDNPRVYDNGTEWRIDVRSRNIGDGQVGFGANHTPLATLSGVPMSNPGYSMAILPNSTLDVPLFTIPKNQTSSGSKILRLHGAYPGGSYASSLRVTIP
ncbi:MAG TPA: hypothetical protein VNT99_10500 [Methylomirabilota bacterium]|nr:hypothetical protein [Methylomirabilota bacterium]